MSRRLSFLLVFGALLVATVVFLQTGSLGTSALWRWSNEGQWLLPLVIVAANGGSGLAGLRSTAADTGFYGPRRCPLIARLFKS